MKYNKIQLNKTNLNNKNDILKNSFNIIFYILKIHIRKIQNDIFENINIIIDDKQLKIYRIFK